MSWTQPATAISGAVVEAVHRNILRDNQLWFNALVPVPASSGLVPSLDSATGGTFKQLDGHSFAAGAITTATLDSGAATTAKIADGAVTAQKFSSAAAQRLVPAGLVQMVRLASEIASGWARESALDGRYPVGDGTTFSTTFVEETSYGTDDAHEHSGSSVVTSGAADNTAPNLSEISPAQATRATGTHTHQTTITVSAAAWTIPSHAYVYTRKT